MHSTEVGTQLIHNLAANFPDIGRANIFHTEIAHLGIHGLTIFYFQKLFCSFISNQQWNPYISNSTINWAGNISNAIW